MYEIRKLEHLAADDAFVATVHRTVRDLFAAEAVTDARNVGALLRYGPQHPGAALRLLHLWQWLNADQVSQEMAERLSSLAERVRNCDSETA